MTSTGPRLLIHLNHDRARGPGHSRCHGQDLALPGTRRDASDRARAQDRPAQGGGHPLQAQMRSPRKTRAKNQRPHRHGVDQGRHPAGRARLEAPTSSRPIMPVVCRSRAAWSRAAVWAGAAAEEPASTTNEATAPRLVRSAVKGQGSEYLQAHFHDHPVVAEKSDCPTKAATAKRVPRRPEAEPLASAHTSTWLVADPLLRRSGRPGGPAGRDDDGDDGGQISR